MDGTKNLYFLSVEFLQEAGPRFLPASWRISAGSGTRVRKRSSLSQCRSRWSGLLPAGPRTATRSSYADARSANRKRSSDTAVAASRHTMNITTGSEFVAADAPSAARRSPFSRCFLFLTRTSLVFALPGVVAAPEGTLFVGKGRAQVEGCRSGSRCFHRPSLVARRRRGTTDPFFCSQDGCASRAMAGIGSFESEQRGVLILADSSARSPLSYASLKNQFSPPSLPGNAGVIFLRWAPEAKKRCGRRRRED
jgi:hypothetical protein